MSRKATIARKTKETDIVLDINLDGVGATNVDTGIGFFNHMLDAFGRHGLFDIDLSAKGDLIVDGHHTVEDVGIVLGKAVAEALGDKRGIVRFGEATVPMDEALVQVAIDVSGRGSLHWNADLPLQMLGSFDTALAKEFFIAFATNAGITMHVRLLEGENAHHMIEAMFKASGRALRVALEHDPRVGDALPSTKGSL